MFGFRPTWRSPFIVINRFEASVEENVPYGKMIVQPRSSSDVNSNPKQTQRSNMGSIPGKTWAGYAERKLLRQNTR